MLPVCSTTTNSSCHTQIPISGALKPFSPLDVNYIHVDKTARNFPNGVLLDRVSLVESLKRRPASCYFSNHVGNIEHFGSVDTINRSVHHIGLTSMKQLKNCSYQVGVIDQSHGSVTSSLVYVDGSSSSIIGDQPLDLTGIATDKTVDVPSYADPEFTTPFYGVTSDPSPVSDPPVPDSFNIDVDQLSDQKISVSEMSKSFTEAIQSGENILNSSVDSVTSTAKTTLTSAKNGVDSVINDIVSFFNKSGESVGNKLDGLSGGLKEASGRGGLSAVDALRKTVLVIEESLTQGAKNVGYAYTFAKEALPPDFQQAISLSESSFGKVFGPVGAAFQQVYVVLEELGKSLGLDPNDPLVQLALFLGFSVILWGSYRVFVYGGYAGDLSPNTTIELLRGNEDVVLIDIRPENLKERDGIPDLRRSARSRYASISVPEIGDSVKKMLKGGRDVEELLFAAIIRNLKIVEGRTNVLVMDADGTRSKGVARSLRRLGTKRSYLVRGGFRSWVNDGFRIKELKPETALTILNEEAEAILEEINPTPLKLVGYGLVFVSALYSLVEWEKTLQFIAVIGLGQSILRRVGSYQNAEDVKNDLGILLTPARFGSRAITWVANKYDKTRNGLPTSPSSSDVQSRVLQAAAKHESQPEETKDPSSVSGSGNAEVNVSEA